MGWFSKFRLPSGAVAAARGPAPDAESLQETRVRARRRLMGAVVLVVIAVIGFPLIFETQPRPIPVDIPIEIPRKEGLPMLVVPAAQVAAPVVVPLAAPTAAQTPTVESASAPLASVEPAASEAKAAPMTVPTATVTASETATPATPVVVPAVKAADKSASSASIPSRVAVKPGSAAEGDRAKALLDGSPSPKVDVSNVAGRFVVQVGAFAENDAARQTRLKVEKLGLKTYVQAAQTPDGKRIRVRVGPYVNKEEAEKARNKLTAGGFPAVLLTL